MKQDQQYDQDFHDKVAKLACAHFNNLPKKGKPLTNQWTTLAAIVQSSSLSLPSSSTVIHDEIVVSCATGTKCLGQLELSPNGDLISDSHAEVLSRRSFLLYLFDQLQLCASKSQNSIFHQISTICSTSTPSALLTSFPQYKLRNGIEFHLFVSQVPCGDASIILEKDDNDSYTSQESTASAETSDDDGESEPKKLKLEISNRTGAKLQVGQLIYEEIQTIGKCRVKPGKGNPTLCMSCSDKIAKWQILGLQGCLLSNIIPIPIRFSSITIGASVPFKMTSLARAVNQRFIDQLQDIKDDEFKPLLNGYTIPIIGQSNVNFSNCFDPSLEIRPNPSPSSIIWYLASNNLIDDATGSVQVSVNGRKQGATKKQFGTPSAMVNICRRNIFKRFTDDYVKYQSPDKFLTYLEAKQLNQMYQKCWSIIKSHVLINWTNKPDNMQIFNLK
ncbi:tRNA-specific adenosine deaminase 1 [Folsomia candida]|uniref:tRNA-specific adenosine deaminase 1 n=1 Tax=Folsomia candida TaxID=158441 RepID=UPI000B9075FA|nr:tRNA-specific adenosine deaminase 1 [Folsomia candida]